MTGVVTLIATACDQRSGVASIPDISGYATIAIPMKIAKKQDPIGFRYAVVAGYSIGIISLGIGVRLAWYARK